jgi:hypothetical protein
VKHDKVTDIATKKPRPREKVNYTSDDGELMVFLEHVSAMERSHPRFEEDLRRMKFKVIKDNVSCDCGAKDCVSNFATFEEFEAYVKENG